MPQFATWRTIYPVLTLLKRKEFLRRTYLFIVMAPGSSTAGPLTTHVLDTSVGRPAEGIHVDLSRDGEPIGSGSCGADGRFAGRLIPEDRCPPGIYRLRFDTSAYFASKGKYCFYPYCEITFQIDKESCEDNFHVPLILSPHGYSTYRGS
jgi:5-hydroxyisourate hydrolase